RFLEAAAAAPRATRCSIPRPNPGSPAACHTWAAVAQKISPIRVRRSPTPFVHSPIRPELGSRSGGFALAHCDAAPVPTARDRFALIGPGSAHHADHLFDCSW